MQAKSAIGRERAVEHIISEVGHIYRPQLIPGLHQTTYPGTGSSGRFGEFRGLAFPVLPHADDPYVPHDSELTSVMFNDNTIFEHILQDDIFMGVIGMLECMFDQRAGLTER